MSPRGFNDALAALPAGTERVRIVFATARSGFGDTAGEFPTPAPVIITDRNIHTHVELRYPSGAKWRVSCYDIERVEVARIRE